MPRAQIQEVTDTKELILASAERLFAEHGVAGASLRAITQDAGVNLAAVNYHFGSKDGLLLAVLERRLKPLAETRLRLLESAERQGGGETRLERIVEAFVQPALEMVGRERGGHAFARFLLRTFSEPDEEIRALLFGQFERTIEAFTRALGRCLPELSREEILWRFHFMVGSMSHTIGLGSLIEKLSGGRCDPRDVEGTTRRLVTFIAAGMRCPTNAGGAGENH